MILHDEISWRSAEFVDGGASFRVRCQRQLDRLHPQQRYVYEHIFDRSTIRLLRAVRVPIVIALGGFAASAVFTIIYALAIFLTSLEWPAP